WPKLQGSTRDGGSVCPATWVWQTNYHLSLEGLGHLATTLLGYSHPRALLREGRYRPGSREGLARSLARKRRHHSDRWLTAGSSPRISKHHVSKVRWPGSPRDRHNGYLRRFVVVLLPLHGRAQR